MKQAAQADTGRPKLIWVIFLFTLLWVAFIALSLYLAQSGVVPLNAERLRYARSLSPIDYGITAMVSILNVAGAIALIRLQSAAIYLYATALAVGILHRLIAANVIATAQTSDRPTVIQTFLVLPFGRPFVHMRGDSKPVVC